MKTIGLVGGMSWHSTMTYYERINRRVAAARGGHASAPIALQSLDFAEVRECQLAGDWQRSADLLAGAARRTVAGGADLVGLCTNLMHKNFPAMEAAVDVPSVHIADAVAAVAVANGWRSVGLLGARWVMEETFYPERLASHGIATVIPDAEDRTEVDRVVFDELTQGRIVESSRERYAAIVARLAEAGADAVVLACTEIGLLLPPASSTLPLIDSAHAHADLLADLALA